jgi:hypothetical protein
MNCLRAVAAAVVVASVALTAAGQKPDFSGTWITMSPADAAGQEQWITQDATTLTTGHGSEGGGHSFTYKLDGTESRQVLTSHGEHVVTLATAVWKAEQLIITQKTTYPDGRKRTASSTWSIDASGRLVVELTEEFDGQPPNTRRMVSRKKS